MFRFFRKHSWILIVVIALTVISMLWFMGTPNRGRGNGSGGPSDWGTIYGHEVSQQEVTQSRNDFEIYCRFFRGAWPEVGPNLTQFDIDKQIFQNLLLTLKAKNLGIVISDQATATAAQEMLSSTDLNRNLGNRSSQPVDMRTVVEQVLQPHGLTDLDFQHFIRTQLTIEQLQLSLGMPGALVTPQEAESLFDHDHQQASVQAVFFSASNYVNRVTASPALVGQYFTNYMAYYRLPDRIQVNYIWLNITNFLDQSKAEWAKTNFDAVVDAAYRQSDAAQFPDAKTPDAVKAKIRDILIKRRALQDANVIAQNFVTTLFALDPVKFDNFITVAKQKGLTVHTSAPFGQNGGDAEFPNAPDVPKAAFGLSQETPFANTILGEDGLYLIGLQAQIPSSMPAFNEIAGQVTRDYQNQEAIAMARSAGTNFYYSAAVLTASGQTLAKAAVAKGITPIEPEPFSLSSSDIPEIGDHAELGAFKQATFSTPVGKLSQFVDTADGGFVVYVKSLSPPDAANKATELPKFVSQLRRGRENESFAIWVNSEANRESAHVPLLQRDMAAPQKQL